MTRQLDQYAIARAVGGNGFYMSNVRFGPMFASQVRLQVAQAATERLTTSRIGPEHDDLIVTAFEQLRKGLSVDRFLADPKLSRALQRECARAGLRAPECAINLRLFAVRKRLGNQVLRETERPSASRHLIELYGLAVEAGVRFVMLRFGASVDDMIAHPEIGKAFTTFARQLSPGGTAIDYRLCALQIRKSRHITTVYQQRIRNLDIEMLERRWSSIGSPEAAHWQDVPESGGILELRTDDQSLYIVRTSNLANTLESAVPPNAVATLLERDRGLDIASSDTTLRFVTNEQLPSATPKAWELLLIRQLRPRYNLPILRRAA